MCQVCTRSWGENWVPESGDPYDRYRFMHSLLIGVKLHKPDSLTTFHLLFLNRYPYFNIITGHAVINSVKRDGCKTDLLAIPGECLTLDYVYTI